MVWWRWCIYNLVFYGVMEVVHMVQYI